MTEFKDITDEMIMAFIDGELEDRDAERVEYAIARDASLNSKAEMFRRTNQLLKAELTSDEELTPAYIRDRIDKISAEKSRLPERQKQSLFDLVSSYFRFQYALPTAAAFTFGIMLGPSLLNNQGSISDRDIVLRGGSGDQEGIEQGLADYLQAQVIQTGASITNGATLAGQEPFTVTFRAPFAGTATLNEVINGEDGPIIESQQVTEANFITFNPLAVSAQDQLSLRISIADDTQSITVTLNFEIQN